MASRSAKQTRYAQPAQPMVSSAPKTRPSLSSSIRSAVASRKPSPSLKRTTQNFDNKGRIAGDLTDASGNRLGARRQLGEADPATRRAALDAALRPGPPVKATPRPVKTTQPVDPSGAGGRARSKKIDDLVTKMQ
jgi:hypothetical protein